MNENLTKVRRGRKASKAAPIPFRLKQPLARYLRNEAGRHGKTMVRIVEEMLEYRGRFKAWPPEERRTA